MADEIFTDPEETREAWADVRMTDPEEGEWDVDAVVLGGHVQYVDLRIRPELLTSFVRCLIDDVDEDRATAILQSVADRKGLDVTVEPRDASDE